MKKNIILLTLICLGAFAAQAQVSTIVRQDIMNIALQQNIQNIQVQEITMPALQSAPKHYHPCPVMGFVKSGTILYQIEGEEPQILNVGDVFYEPKDKHILHFDNASESEPATFIAMYLIDDNEHTTIIVD